MAIERLITLRYGVYLRYVTPQGVHYCFVHWVLVGAHRGHPQEKLRRRRGPIANPYPDPWFPLSGPLKPLCGLP
jgi:hypothetical protein